MSTVRANETYLARYLRATRSPAYSLLFLLPLILAYECLAVVVNVNHSIEVRNGADVILQQGLLLLNIESLPLAFFLVTLVIIGALSMHLRHGARLRPEYFGAMVIESCLWAFVLGAVSQRMVGIFLSAPAGFIPSDLCTQVMLYLGAGVYEELVFRVLLVSAFLYMLKHALGLRSPTASMFAVLAAALLFSAFHHIGALGEPFQWPIFLFRFFAGLVLSFLYVTRGFGITAWSHALYDLFHLAGWM